MLIFRIGREEQRSSYSQKFLTFLGLEQSRRYSRFLENLLPSQCGNRQNGYTGLTALPGAGGEGKTTNLRVGKE